MDWKSIILAFRYAMRHPAVRLAGLGLGIGFLFTLAALVYWVPEYQEYTGLDEKISSQRKQIYVSEQGKRIAELYNRSKKTLNKLDKKLAANKSQADHVKLLDKMLRNRRLTVVNETFETEKLDDGYVRLSQELSIQGDYSNLRKFLIDLDRLPTWTVVQDLRIEKLHSYGSKVKAVVRMATWRREGKQKNAGA